MPPPAAGLFKERRRFIQDEGGAAAQLGENFQAEKSVSFPKFAVVRLAVLCLPVACGYDKSTLYPTEPPANATKVDVVFCRDTPPAWIAFQDGDGAWTRVSPVVHDQFATVHLSLERPIGGVAVARDH